LDGHRVLALLYATLAVTTTVGGWLLQLRARPDRVLAVSFALMVVWELLRSASARAELRHQADTWIESAGGPFIAPQYTWRVAELVSRRERRALARSVRGIVRLARARFPERSSLIIRQRVVPYVAVLSAIAERLDDLGAPIRPVGVIALRHLLCDAESPLYVSDSDLTTVELAASLAAIRVKLDPRVATARQPAFEGVEA
jgi:hypothetical protein